VTKWISNSTTRNKDFELFAEDCFASDDSVIAIFIAKAIMGAAKSKELTAQGYDPNYHTLLSDLIIQVNTKN